MTIVSLAQRLLWIDDRRSTRWVLPLVTFV
jgi:hypothetical protein